MFQRLGLACLVTLSFANLAGGNELMEIMRTACLALDNLRSGQGSGIFVVERDGVVVTKMSFDVVMEGDNYFLDITHQLTEPPQIFYDRHTVVCVGDAVFMTRYSPSIHPAGCDTQVFRKTRGTIFIASGGFKWDPNRLAKVGMNVIGADDKFDVTVEQTADGTLRANYNISENVAIEFRADPSVGYNVTQTIVTRLNKVGRLPTVIDVTWEEADGVWFVKRFVYDERAQKTKTTVNFETFTPNVPVPDGQFTMAKLNPCAGSRILDHRPKEGPRIYNFEKSPPHRESDLDSVVAQLEVMPPRFPEYESSKANGAWSYRTRLWIAVNVVLAVCTLGWVAVRARKRVR